MPEGPEVKIIAEGLTRHIANKSITSIEINAKSRYHKKAPDGFPEFIASLPVKVTRVHSHGKFIWWEFANGWHAWQTLGLAGGWFLKEKANSGTVGMGLQSHASGTPVPRNSRPPQVGLELSVDGIILTLDSGQKLYYDDSRHFGTLKFIPHTISSQETKKKLKTLGPDILATAPLSMAEFSARLKKYPGHLAINIIAEQKVISGVGNYLRSEILYKSRINPHTTVANLTPAQLTSLYENTYALTRASYEAGGASIQHYSDVNNNPGKFEFQMQVPFTLNYKPTSLFIFPAKAEKQKENKKNGWA